MQSDHDAEKAFNDLPPGHPFRFHHHDESVIALKAGFPGGDQGALVLMRTKAGLQPGNILSAFDVGPKVVELHGVSIVPSRRPGSVTPGAGHFAAPGEIELCGGGLTLVTTPQGGTLLRIDVTSGTIGRATGERPMEIYSEWSVARTTGNKTETLYEHKPLPPDDSGSIVVTLD
jgi:hypothetical protein